jgi:hypothetical protein
MAPTMTNPHAKKWRMVPVDEARLAAFARDYYNWERNNFGELYLALGPENLFEFTTAYIASAPPPPTQDSFLTLAEIAEIESRHDGHGLIALEVGEAKKLCQMARVQIAFTAAISYIQSLRQSTATKGTRG